MMCHARSAWWLETKSCAPRKPRHRPASLGNPKKKKCSLLFDFRGGGFFLKWKGLFSFWGSALQVFGQCGGASIRTRFCKNYFLGIWIFAKPRLICFWILSARRRGLGRNPRGLFCSSESEKEKAAVSFGYHRLFDCKELIATDLGDRQNRIASLDNFVEVGFLAIALNLATIQVLDSDCDEQSTDGHSTVYWHFSDFSGNLANTHDLTDTTLHDGR